MPLPAGPARWLGGLLPGRPLRVLILGNSLSYQEAGAPGGAVVLHDIAGLVGRMSRSRRERRPFEGARVVRDGTGLDLHLADGVFERELASRPWDWVVLQERSERALDEPEKLRADVRFLAQRIRSAGARAALVSTWLPAEKAAHCAAASLLYRGLAGELGALLVPSAEARAEAARARPDVALSREDGLHLSPLGSYLAACVLYAGLYGEGLAAGDAADDGAAVEELRAAHERLDGRPGRILPADLAFLRSLAVECAVSVRDGVPAEEKRPL